MSCSAAFGRAINLKHVDLLFLFFLLLENRGKVLKKSLALDIRKTTEALRDGGSHWREKTTPLSSQVDIELRGLVGKLMLW